MAVAVVLRDAGSAAASCGVIPVVGVAVVVGVVWYDVVASATCRGDVPWSAAGVGVVVGMVSGAWLASVGGGLVLGSWLLCVEQSVV